MPTVWRVRICGHHKGRRKMRSDLKLSAATLLPGIVAAALLAAPARADVVTDWNVITNALVANDVGNNPKLRTLAMVHVAMSDAINTVQNRYTRVVATLPAAPGASAEAAAATAARQILTQIYPAAESQDRRDLRGIAQGDPRRARQDRRHQARYGGGRRGPGRPRQRRHQRPRHLPAARCPRGLRADDAAAVGAICAREAMGAQERRPVPARPAAGAVERGVGPRLQRGEEPRRHQEHGAHR